MHTSPPSQQLLRSCNEAIVEGHRGVPQPLVVRIHGLHFGEAERRPEQHRDMTIREHKPITMGPDRVLRIEPRDAVPERVDQGRERHRRAGVSRVRCLHRMDRKSADGIDTQSIQLRVCHGSSHLRVLMTKVSPEGRSL